MAPPPKENRPPRNIPPKNDFGAKRRRVPGAEGTCTMRGAGPGRGRKQDDAGSSDSLEAVAVELTKERVLEMVNDEPKLKQFDTKVNYDRVTRYSRSLKVCVKWYQKEEEKHVQEEERLRTALAAVEAKFASFEEEMKNKEQELSSIISELREQITSLEAKLVIEETDKQGALKSYEIEKSARDAAEKMQASLSEELEKAHQENAAANQQIVSLKDMEKGWKEYNISLRQHMSKLEADLNNANESLKKLEKQKLAILENLSALRVHNSALQDQLDASKSSQEEAIKQQNTLETEVRCLRGDLQQVRDDRDRQVSQVQTLNGELEKYRETTGKSRAEMDSLTTKVIAMEELQSSQREQICLLQRQLAAANEKLKVADLSESERLTESEKQKRTISELQDRLAKTEQQVVEGEMLRKKLHNTILELKGNIRVFCRVRPLLPDDGIGTEAPVISYPTSTEALGRAVDLTQNGKKYAFSFDKVFDHKAAQQDVFVEISQLVQSALDGYKVCIFAYGQTGSGKTYTMMGKPLAMEEKGLIPRSLEQIFQTSQSLAAQGWKYKLQASMLEIYNETIRDLLLTNRSNALEARTENVIPGKQYSIKHDVNGNTHVSDLTIVDVCSLSEISSLLQQASKSRSVGKTQMNEQSSRSHFVFTLRISGVNEHTEQQVQGVLNLIDLAGSERLSRSGATGDRLKETQAINKSLSCLSDVIFSLAKKEEHIPFRNSKLTYLLQPCLGGDSKTLMFVNVSPDPASVGESLCSLRFAARVNACEIGIPRRQTHELQTLV